MEAIRNELVAAEASLETIKQRRLELAEQIAGKRKAGNNNTNLQQELKSTKETLKTATQQVAAAKAKQREQNAANQRNRNAANQRQRNVTARAQRNNQAAQNAKSISWMNRMGNSLARRFNPTPGIGIATRIENAAAKVVNPIPGINPVNYLESAVAEKFKPVAKNVEEQDTNMISDQKRRIDSTLASINTKIEKTTNQQKKNILLALKGLLEKMSSLNGKLAEYLETYEFIPVWIIFTISNLSYLLTLVLMFYFFLGLGQSIILALIVMRIGHTLFGQKSTVVKRTLEATGVAPAARAMYNISVGEAHRSAAQVAEEERKEEEVPIEEEAEEIAQVIATFQREAPDLQARHRVWIMHARKGLPAATGAAQAAQDAYKQAKADGRSNSNADAAADTAGQEAAERISPKPVKQDVKNEEIGGLIGAIGGGILGLFEACGIGRTRRPPLTEEENAKRSEAEWAKLEPLLQDSYMQQERIRVNELSDEELQEEIESNADSVNTGGIIIDGELINRRMAERKLLAFLSRQRLESSPRRRTRKARKSRKQRLN